jgi:uncharacterized membrane protein
MLRRLSQAVFWVLFTIALLVAWRLAGLLPDLVLLVVIVVALILR